MSESESRHYNELRTRMDAMLSHIQAHNDRLLVIETNAERDKDTVAKKQLYLMLLISSALTALWEVLKHAFNAK